MKSSVMNGSAQLKLRPTDQETDQETDEETDEETDQETSDETNEETNEETDDSGEAGMCGRMAYFASGRAKAMTFENDVSATY